MNTRSLSRSAAIRSVVALALLIVLPAESGAGAPQRTTDPVTPADAASPSATGSDRAAGTPDVPLHVSGGSDATITGGGYLLIGPVTGANVVVDNNEIMARDNSTTSTLYLQKSGGSVSIGTNSDAYRLTVNGDVSISAAAAEPFLFINGPNNHPVLRTPRYQFGQLGTVNYPFYRTYSREFFALLPVLYLVYSDERLKENVRPLDDALSLVQRLRGVRYALTREFYYQSDHGTEEERTGQIGLIAQEVEKVFPQMVSTDKETGLKSVGYLALVPVLIEAIKEQQDLIDGLEARLAALEGVRR